MSPRAVHFRWLVPEDMAFFHTLERFGHCKLLQGDYIGGAVSNAKKAEMGSRKQNYKAACSPLY